MEKLRTQVNRGRKRELKEKQDAFKIIDDSLMCHVAQIRNGYPVVTPTCHWRDGDKLYWHGHAKAQNVIGSENQAVCINISQVDGLVLARSAFHHSINYRSLTIFGRPQLVSEQTEKERQLKLFVDKVSPERWSLLRPITQKELMITSVAWISIDEFSVKARAEGVNDDQQDLNWPVWAGVVPSKTIFKAPKQESEQERFSPPNQANIFTHSAYGEQNQ